MSTPMKRIARLISRLDSTKGHPRRLPLWIVPVGLLLLALGCSRGPYPFDFYQEMHYQSSIRAQEPDRRQPAPDSVPRTGRELTYATIVDAADLNNPLPANDITFARARQLYQVNCSACHGSEGKGDGPLVAHFQKYNSPPPVDFSQERTTVRKPGELWWIITNGFPLPGIPQPGGPGGMPSFRNLLTDDDRWALVHFVQTVR